jgi:hypothetical protein
MVLNRAFLALAVCLSAVPFAAASRSVTAFQYQSVSREKALDRARFVRVASNRRLDILAELSAEESLGNRAVFGLEQAAFIRDWFSQQEKLGTLPVDLANAETPPSLQRDGILPADLRQRVQPLPLALESQLPTLTGNLRRVIVLGDVVLLDEDTSRIVDFIPGVLDVKSPRN